MVEPWFVLDDTHQRLLPEIKSDMPHAARDGEHIARLSMLRYPSYPDLYLPMLNMKDLILIDMHVLKRDVSTRVDGPLHGKCLFVIGNAPEGFAGDGIGERLVQVDTTLHRGRVNGWHSIPVSGF
jgi:hypothetical protein